MSDATSLGTVVKSLRIQRGMALAELARQAGISKGHLSQIENHRQEPRVELAVRIAQLLGVTVEDLISARSEPAIECPVCSGRGWCKPSDLQHVRYGKPEGGE
jgi:transcriptional regulator with XRE-family HTH domain